MLRPDNAWSEAERYAGAERSGTNTVYAIPAGTIAVCRAVGNHAGAIRTREVVGTFVARESAAVPGGLAGIGGCAIAVARAGSGADEAALASP